MDKNKIIELQVEMTRLQELQDYIANAKKEFEETIALEVSRIKETSDKINELKAAIEPEALADYTKLGVKKLDGGIGIQERKYIDMDEEKVREWCFEKQMFLEVDVKGFSKAAPSLKLPFAVEKKELKVTFPKELKIELN